MTITIEKLNHLFKDDPLHWSLIRSVYSVYDIDFLSAHRTDYEPLEKMEAAEIIRVSMTGNPDSKYFGVVCKLFIASPVDNDRTGVYAVNVNESADEFNDVYSNGIKALEKAVKKAGGGITLVEDEWPEIKDYLAGLARALGRDNIAIHKWER
jgi:hypothetical protein